MSDPTLVSFFTSFGAKPNHVAPRTILEDIQSGKYAARIESLRSLYKTNPVAYQRRKRQLPAFTMSGTMADRKTPLAHSGLLQVDLDHLGGTLEDLRTRLRADPHVAFGFLSPSGDGLKLGLRIDGNRHAASFTAAERYFYEVYKVHIDPAVKDRGRLCFVSHDPDAWINEHATPLPLPPEFTESTQSTQSTEVIGCVGVLSSLPVGESYSVKPLSCSVNALAEVVRLCVPRAPRRNNRSLFHLARGLLGLALKTPLSLADRMHAFDLWYTQTLALGFLREGQDRGHYELEFMNAIKTARVPLDESPVHAAWKRAATATPPPEAQLFQSPEARQLLALCQQLELGSGHRPWFLSCRDAAVLIAASHTKCSQWLSAFVSLGILTVDTPATKQHATRYRWTTAGQ